MTLPFYPGRWGFGVWQMINRIEVVWFYFYFYILYFYFFFFWQTDQLALLLVLPVLLSALLLGYIGMSLLVILVRALTNAS